MGSSHQKVNIAKLIYLYIKHGVNPDSHKSGIHESEQNKMNNGF